MCEILEKKKRAPNYSNREKSLLLETISEFKNIIENKQTDAITWKNKEEAWGNIAKLFNCRSTENINRTQESLRKYYENIKKNVRKQVVEEKKEIYSTGGGMPKKIVSDECKELVLGIINHKTVYGLSNPYDGDSQSKTPDQMSEDPNATDFEDNATNFEILEHNYERRDIELKSGDKGPTPAIVYRNEHKKVDSAQLRQPKDTALQHKWTSRRRPAIQQQYSSKLAEEYSELAKLKMSLYTEERENHKRQEERNNEIHKLKRKKLLLEINKIKLETQKLRKT